MTILLISEKYFSCICHANH